MNHTDSNSAVETDISLEAVEITLKEAALAATEDEVPVGAVVLRDGRIIASAHNLTKSLKDPSAHAEVLAIRKAAEVLESSNLASCDLYVSLEPCLMCAGLIINSKIDRLYFGALDKKGGCISSVYNAFELPLNHRPEFYSYADSDWGLRSSNILKDFFRRKRKSKAEKRKVKELRKNELAEKAEQLRNEE